MPGYVYKGTRKDEPEPDLPPEEVIPEWQQVKPCGTSAAYKRHQARGEKPCEECTIARKRDRADYKAGVLKAEPRAVAPCGTRAAYERHLRHGEEPCDPCRAANAESFRAGYHRRKGPASYDTDAQAA